MLHDALSILPNLCTRLKELSLLNMAAMDFVELPVVAISLHDSRVLYRAVNIIHVLKTPQARTDRLRDWKAL